MQSLTSANSSSVSVESAYHHNTDCLETEKIAITDNTNVNLESMIPTRLSQRTIPKRKLFETFLHACETGHLEDVNYLISACGVNPGAKHSLGLVKAVDAQQLLIVKRLMDDDRVSVSVKHGKPVYRAICLGNLEMLDSMLNRPGINPCVKQSRYLIKAAEMGHADIVERLLQHPDVDPSARDNLALLHAAEQGNEQIAKLLLGDDRTFVYGSACDNVIQEVLRQKDTDLLNQIIQHPRATFNQSLYLILRSAVKNRWMDTLRLLLQNPRLNHGYGNEWVFYETAKFALKCQATLPLKYLLRYARTYRLENYEPIRTEPRRFRIDPSLRHSVLQMIQRGELPLQIMHRFSQLERNQPDFKAAVSTALFQSLQGIATMTHPDIRKILPTEVIYSLVTNAYTQALTYSMTGLEDGMTAEQGDDINHFFKSFIDLIDPLTQN